MNTDKSDVRAVEAVTGDHLYSVEATMPIGTITIAALSDVGICYIAFGELADVRAELRRWADRWVYKQCLISELTDASEHPVLADAVLQLEQYFAGELSSFSLPLQLLGTPFQREVWAALRQIPYGETRSYKQIAEAIGKPKAVRAVGGANNRNPLSILVPCHRVIGSGGQLVGYGGGLPIKTALLDLERQVQEQDQSQVLHAYSWN